MIAIQNRMRVDLGWRAKSQRVAIHIAEYVCFGVHDVDHIRNLGGTIYAVYPVGPLKAREYVQKSSAKDAPSNGDEKYEICVIGDNFSGWGRHFPGIKDAFGSLATWTQSFC